jgi:hypothetical protein
VIHGQPRDARSVRFSGALEAFRVSPESTLGLASASTCSRRSSSNGALLARLAPVRAKGICSRRSWAEGRGCPGPSADGPASTCRSTRLFRTVRRPRFHSLRCWTAGPRLLWSSLIAPSPTSEEQCGRVVAVLGGHGDLEVQARCSPDGLVSLSAVTISGFRMVRVPRSATDDRVRYPRLEGEGFHPSQTSK